ncbi:MAG TPA: Ig-like domain-containing protein [Verrucomicrobiae bacterium]|nr:Ig-like domain-containing protein [Verrucomicrobiae bacterium]
MKLRKSIPSLIFCVLNVLWFASAPTAHSEWLALDGENNIWWLADTNGAVSGQFANLPPDHQQWMAMNRAPNGGGSVLKLGGDVTGDDLEVYTLDGITNGEVGGFNLGPFQNGNLLQPGSWTFDAAGDLYIADNYYSHIVHYNGTNGAYLGVFVSSVSPNNMTFGPDGNLYVADSNLGVVRYNGTNGDFMDTFVPLGTNGVPDAANLLFGPDENLYVYSASSNAVMRFDGHTGQFIGYFVPPGNAGLGSGMAFGPDGNFYTTSGSSILRYDGRTGAFLNTFASGIGLGGLLGLAYLSDTNPPTVTIASPANNTMISGTVTVSVNAADNGAITAVQFQLDGTNFGAPLTATPYAVTWNTTTATDGAHTLTAFAWDATGNEGVSAPVTVSVANGDPADTTPPVVNITAPANNAKVSGTVSVSADATDDTSVAYVQFQLDGVNLGWTITNAPYTVAWNTASVTNGTHILTALAQDTAGNQAISGPVTLSVTNAEPGPTLFVSDSNGNIIKIAPDGTQSIFATATNAFYGLAFDRSGNLFASEYSPGIIYKFTPDGAQSAFNNSSNACSAYSLVFDNAGNLFADCANVIYKFTPDGTRSVFTTTPLYASYPSAETFDNAGNFYFTTWTFNTPNGGPQDIIAEYAPDGSSRTYETLQAGYYGGFFGMAFDAAGNLLLNGTGGMAFDDAGNLYEANRSSGNIYKIAPDGTQTTYVSGLNGPVGLTIAPSVTLSDPPPQLPPPRLSIQLTATNTVQISWPSIAGTNWTLCCQPGMCSTNSWSVLTNPPVLVGTNYVVTESCASTAFYRLEQK